ncbi:hypothetical protein THAOC_26455 [Thalassiosira oceanica]|uniref:Uncharacterized protein n=1 Tax=Thalassiosira oceanica TaxID=159749 RepID=K0RLD6_THAOC|nr:hypothetical protein THAOC_26455 [Thalassiosira oceanica]|eukprot:EJK54000.1 hypothetical protein THAOC_26455 [Thalassiosira oceanica]
MHSPRRAIITQLFCQNGTTLRRCLPTAFGLGPRLLNEGDLLIIVGVEAVGPIQVDWGVYRLGYHHFALRVRGVTPCDTSHDVAPTLPTPDFSGSDDETKAQAPAQGPHLMIRWTDGAEGGRDRPGRWRTGLEDAISGPRPILRFVTSILKFIRPSSQSREK